MAAENTHREMIRSRSLPVLLCGFLLAVTAVSQTAVSEKDGSAEITLTNGTKTTVLKERGQVGIGAAQIAPDGTVGWLVLYSIEGVSYPVAGTLITWRDGRIIKRFDSKQTFYSWTFEAKGKQVAYHAGPLHGEAKSHCELHDSRSGRLLAAWDGDLQSASKPAWTNRLSH